MSERMAWLAGLSLCLVCLALGYTSSEWVENFGLSRADSRYIPILLLALSTFIVACFAGRHSWLKALLLIFTLAVAGTVINFIVGELDGLTDFPGLAGASPYFTMMIVITAPIMVPGMLLGLLVKRVLLRRTSR